MKKYKCASFFAGVGGIDLGFEQTGYFETVYANEIDPSPVKTFEKNFNLSVDRRDIREVKGKEIPDFDILLAGFPCQAFSIAGYQQGFNDSKGRGTMFFELMRIIDEKKKKPEVIFLENVKNLKNHDNGRTFKTIINFLEERGYKYIYSDVLNAMEYGNMPQNRERIYIVAFKNESQFSNFDKLKKIKLTTKLEDLIDYSNKVDDKYYYDSIKYPKIMNEFKKISLNEDSIYQWRRVYVRENKSGVCPTLTANMGEGGHNVPIIYTKNGIRKLTPRECFNIQGFPKKFNLPDTVNSKLYKQAGNSVCVKVINRLANNIYKALSI